MEPYLLDMPWRAAKRDGISCQEHGYRFLGGIYHTVLVGSSSSYEKYIDSGLVMVIDESLNINPRRRGC